MWLHVMGECMHLCERSASGISCTIENLISTNAVLQDREGQTGHLTHRQWSEHTVLDVHLDPYLKLGIGRTNTVCGER